MLYPVELRAHLKNMRRQELLHPETLSVGMLQTSVQPVAGVRTGALITCQTKEGGVDDGI